MRTEKIIGNKRCYLYGDSGTSHILIQAVDEHDMEILDREVEKIKELAPGHPFTLAAFSISGWNRELSPWRAPAAFGREDFGAGADDTLAYITEELLPSIEKTYHADVPRRYFLGGYSLAGLFSLWAAYQEKTFQGIAAVSPSVWFPGWESFISENEIYAQRVYLSLGDKEAKTKNPVMSKVGDNIRKQYERLCGERSVKACVLEWNPGNHFVDSEVRMAKGFAWLLKSCYNDSNMKEIEAVS